MLTGPPMSKEISVQSEERMQLKQNNNSAVVSYRYFIVICETELTNYLYSKTKFVKGFLFL